VPAKILVKLVVACSLELVRLSLVLVLVVDGALPPPFGEALFDWRSVAALLVGPASSSTESVRIATRPIYEQGPAEVGQVAHALPRRELRRPLMRPEETDPDPVADFDAGVLAA
jgi:hypothetical protein